MAINSVQFHKTLVVNCHKYIMKKKICFCLKYVLWKVCWFSDRLAHLCLSACLVWNSVYTSTLTALSLPFVKLQWIYMHGCIRKQHHASQSSLVNQSFFYYPRLQHTFLFIRFFMVLYLVSYANMDEAKFANSCLCAQMNWKTSLIFYHYLHNQVVKNTILKYGM